jgi:hypothetical protein
MDNRIGQYVIARGTGSGVNAGILESAEPCAAGAHVVLRNARKIYYWAGGATLHELAQRGTSDAGACKFPAPVDRVEQYDVCEIIDVSPEARKSIEGVKVWSK